MNGRCAAGELREVAEDRGAVSEPSASNFTDDKRMRYDAVLDEEVGKARIPTTEVIEPHRRIDEDHPRTLGRRRGADRACASDPPRAASRFPASRAINAFRPACTNAVFS